MLVASPAAAAPGDDFSDLQTALDSCTGTTSITLTDNIDDALGELIVNCAAKIDLAGHDLTARNIVISVGHSLTIDDSSSPSTGTLKVNAPTHVAGIQNTDAILTINGGTVNATGGGYAAGIGGVENGPGGTTIIHGRTLDALGGAYGAGIGGGNHGDGGTTTINGGTVTAASEAHGAGIGGGAEGDGGTTMINGGTVAAASGESAAAIGGGYQGDGDTTTINGGTVTAASGTISRPGDHAAAGIGGGSEGGGGVVQVGAGAVVTASGDATAIGAGKDSSTFGSLNVYGTLRLPSGEFVIPDSNSAGPEVTVSPTGTITGSTDIPASYAQFSGGGQISNHGAITLPTINVTGGSPVVGVLDHHYQVVFDPQNGATPTAVTVFADSFTHGSRVFPADPTKTGGYTFDEWNNAADGTGTVFTTGTVLSGSSSDGNAVDSTIFAQYGVSVTETSVSSSANPSTYGDSVTFTATVAPDTGAGTVDFVDTTAGGNVAVCTSVSLASAAGDTQEATCTTSALGAGTHTITANYSGGGGYAASSGSVDQVITEASVVIIPDDQAITYGDGDPVFTYSVSGLIGDDTLSADPSCGVAGSHDSAASYAITCSGAVAGGNYVVDQSATGTLTVAKATLTVTADDASRTYGAENPAFTGTVAGYVNSDTAATAYTGAPAFSSASSAADVGTYPITLSTGTLASTNYDFTFVDGTLTIERSGTSLKDLQVSVVRSLWHGGITFKATLTSDTTGQGIEDKTVNFEFVNWSGEPTGVQCSTVTGPGGVAHCFAPMSLANLLTMLLSNGNVAIYDGSSNYLPSVSDLRPPTL